MAQLPILSPFVASLGAGVVYSGVILGSYSMVNMATNVVAGPLIDGYGHRAVTILGLLVAGLSVAGYAAALQPWQLLLLRIMHGIGGGLLIPAIFTWAGSRSRPQQSGRTMGYAAAAVALAALLGPAAGGIGSSVIGTRMVFILLGTLLVVTGMQVMLFLRRPVVLTGRKECSPRFSNIRAVLGNPAILESCGSILILTFSTGTLAFVFPLQMESSGFSAAHTGAMFSLYSLSAIALQVLPTRKLLDRIGLTKTLLTGSLLAAAGLTLLAMDAGGAVAGAAMVVFGTGFSAVFSASSAMLVSAADNNAHGTAFGIYFAVFSLGVFIGPAVAGFATALEISGYLPAILILLTGRLLIGLFRRKHTEEEVLCQT